MKPAFRAFGSALLVVCAAAGTAQVALGQLQSVPEVHGDVSRGLLGDGTGVIIGSVDSGIDSTHPALAGNDSLGNPRLVAQQNFTSEPANTGGDVFGHGTWTASIMLSSDPTYTGFAPDARYVNARVLDSTNSFGNNSVVLNGIGFDISHGAQVINLSLNYFSGQNNGNDAIERIVDWASEAMNVNFTVSAGNISTGDGTQQVRGPASAYNSITVGRTTETFDQVHFDSSIGPTGDGRAKPDVVAPGTRLIMAKANRGIGDPLWDPTPHNGTSFSAPAVAGLMAQAIDYGQVHGFSTNPLVIKATIMNSAAKVRDKDGTAWKPAAGNTLGGVMQSSSPLDSEQGTGQIDGVRLFQQYSAGQQGPGTVNPIGWDLRSISGVSSATYNIGAPLAAGSLVDVTLDWFRHVNRIDNGNGVIDAFDSYIPSGTLDNLDLTVLLNGVAIAKSMSTIDNLEYLHLALPQAGTVSIQVDRLDVPNSGTDELYGLAWSTAVPEPATLLLAATGITFASLCAGRARRRLI